VYQPPNPIRCCGLRIEGRFYNEFLLTEAQRDHSDVVLVSPRNPLNIGAAARAMANFGFSRLSVVAPFEAHWREARSAVGAPELLANAQEYSTLAEAIAGNTLVIGTGTRTHRKPEQPAVLLPALTSLVEEESASGGRLALVFGPEKRGLTREDLSRCHLLVEIPTDARQPSMNLGQAVAVCLYELTRRGPGPAEPPRMAEAERGAASGALDRLADVIEETMTASGYSPQIMQAAKRHNLRVLLRRLSWTESDAKRALGVFRRVLWRLQHPGKS
jgi:TrmH family RNA methyltransferase